MKAGLYALTALFFTLVGALYAGLGWTVAWILEAAWSIDVNYAVFVWVGLGIYAVCLIPILFFAGLSNMLDKQLKKDFDINI